MSHYEATLIIGHVAAVVSVMGTYFRLHWKFMRRMAEMNRTLTKFLVEHEIVVDYICKQQGIKREDLPTRHVGGFEVNGF